MIEVKSYIVELDVLLEKGAAYAGSPHSDPLARVYEIVGALKNCAANDFQREKIGAVTSKLKIWFTENQSAANAPINYQRRDALIAIDNLKRAFGI